MLGWLMPPMGFMPPGVHGLVGVYSTDSCRNTLSLEEMILLPGWSLIPVGRQVGCRKPRSDEIC